MLRACAPIMSRAASHQAASTSQGSEAPHDCHSLFVYPLESNFSGARYCPGGRFHLGTAMYLSEGQETCVVMHLTPVTF